MKILLYFIVIILFVTGSAGCATLPQRDRTLQLIERNIPTMDGSTSTLPLRVLLVCKAFDVPCHWSNGPGEHTITTDLSGTTEHLFNNVLYDNVPNSGTHDAYLALVDQKADLILVAREPNDDELRTAAVAKVKLDIRVVALDAFVFLAHSENPVHNLSLDTASDIYSGQIKNWADVGGKDELIHAYQRDKNSGSQELMESLVMKNASMIDAPDMVEPSMMGAINKLAGDELGLGYSVYYYVVNMLPSPDVKLLSINGIAPTAETIANHTYPLTTEVYVVTLTEDTAPPLTEMFSKNTSFFARKIRDWLFTDNGQATIKESGYVPSR
jgi:phosphate transport system substrate-binding protein